MFHPLGFFFAVEGFCLQAEQCWPSALLPPVNLRGCQSCHRNGESRPLQSLQPLGKCSERTAAQTPTQTKFLLDSWMRILQINFEIITKPD